MIYIFFTNSMGGISGGSTYVRNKLVHLRNLGWKVQIFDSTGFTNAAIVIEELKEFGDNRYKELFFNPYWLNKSRREKIIGDIIKKIGKDETIVIESNNVAMSIWGEIIASRIGAKHLIYLLSEKLTISDETLYKYYKYKSSRGELFSIGVRAYRNLMQKFENVTDADEHYWSARINVPIEDVRCECLDNIDKADFNIGHFGRQKGYFHYMFENVAGFARKHNNEKVNFLVLGIPEISDNL